MGLNPFTVKSIKGVFSNIPNYLKKHREEKKEEKRINTLIVKQEHKDQNKLYNQSYVEEAREHQKEKARAVLASNAPLAKKLIAINELHKDHRQPKINPAIQELADRAYINRYKKDQRLERQAMIKKVLDEDKTNKIHERIERMNQVRHRNNMLKINMAADKLIREAKFLVRGKHA